MSQKISKTILDTSEKSIESCISDIKEGPRSTLPVKPKNYSAAKNMQLTNQALNCNKQTERSKTNLKLL